MSATRPDASKEHLAAVKQGYFHLARQIAKTHPVDIAHYLAQDAKEASLSSPALAVLAEIIPDPEKFIFKEMTKPKHKRSPRALDVVKYLCLKDNRLKEQIKKLQPFGMVFADPVFMGSFIKNIEQDGLSSGYNSFNEKAAQLIRSVIDSLKERGAYHDSVTLFRLYQKALKNCPATFCEDESLGDLCLNDYLTKGFGPLYQNNIEILSDHPNSSSHHMIRLLWQTFSKVEKRNFLIDLSNAKTGSGVHHFLSFGADLKGCFTDLTPDEQGSFKASCLQALMAYEKATRSNDLLKQFEECRQRKQSPKDLDLDLAESALSKLTSRWPIERVQLFKHILEVLRELQTSEEEFAPWKELAPLKAESTSNDQKDAPKESKTNASGTESKKESKQEVPKTSELLLDLKKLGEVFSVDFKFENNAPKDSLFYQAYAEQIARANEILESGPIIEALLKTGIAYGSYGNPKEAIDSNKLLLRVCFAFIKEDALAAKFTEHFFKSTGSQILIGDKDMISALRMDLYAKLAYTMTENNLDQAFNLKSLHQEFLPHSRVLPPVKTA